MRETINVKLKKIQTYFLFLVPLYLFINIYLSFIGEIAIIITLLLTFLLFVINLDFIKFDRIFIWYLLFTIFSFGNLLRNFSQRGFIEFSMQTSLLLNFIILPNSNFNDKLIRTNIIVYSFILSAILTYSILIDPGRGAIFYFSKILSPTIYKSLFPLLFFNLYHFEKFKKSLFVFSLILFFYSVERTMVLSFLISCGVWLYYLKRKISYKLHKNIFRVIFIGFIIIIYLYVLLSNSNSAPKIDDLFLTLTGGRFFSGRNNIWSIIINQSGLGLYFGNGFNNTLLKNTGIELSSHNTYLHIISNHGAIGLLLFYKILLSLWEKMYINYLNNKIFSISFFVGFLFYMMSEVTLIGNSVLVSIYAINMILYDFYYK